MARAMRALGGESKRNPGQESDLGVGGFDRSLAEAAVQGRVDGIAVSHDAACQLNEHRDAAARCPGDPPVQGLLAFPAFDRNHVAQALFEQICPMQAGSVLAIQAQGGQAFGKVVGVAWSCP
jgi:hypothetical protein